MEAELKQAQNKLIKIVLFGPESTGKTTLAKTLAQEYNTQWVPEFARDYLQKKYDDSAEICEPSDLIPIVKGQIQSENKLIQKAHRFLFCDTNSLQTLVYAKAYFENFHNSTLEECVNQHQYDYYFLNYIDTPWVEDDLRDKPHERKSMFSIFEGELIKRQLPYTILRGSLEERIAKAQTILKTL